MIDFKKEGKEFTVLQWESNLLFLLMI